MKEQVEALLDKLKNHEDVSTFSFYEDKEQIFGIFITMLQDGIRMFIL